MPTILELFESNDFQSKGLSQKIPSTPDIEGRDTSTLKELYENKESYVFGTNYSNVKTKKPPKNSTFNTITNFVEQEATGLRIKSAAELNNPLIYGNEVGRISLRSTPDLEKMKDGAKPVGAPGEGGDGGLIGKGLGKLTGGKVNSVSELRDKVNSKLGIPVNLIPTRLIGKIDTKDFSSIEPVTPEIYGNNGTELGKLLKESGGGTPKNIVKNAAGAGIKKFKKNLRKSLFEDSTSNPFKKKTPGSQGNISDVTGEKDEKFGYSNIEPYTKQLEKERGADQLFGSEPIPANEFKGIDLTKVSPIHGIKRSENYFGDGDAISGGSKASYGFQDKSDGKYLPKYTSETDNGYSKKYSQRDDKVPTLRERGMDTGKDVIGLGDPYTTTVNTENGEVTVEGFAPVRDLVPLFIGRYKSTTYPMMAFRCNITGLTETSSPSWASNNFVGNPYKYYIFETVERSVSFNLQVYAQNPLELANNWSKLSNLTKLSYPLIEDNMAHPNFVQFSLGDMYRDKVCIMDSLSYTFPDNGTWETNIDGLLLPKFIDVALTLKFVENIEDGSIRGLYSYPKNLSSAGEVSSQHEIYSNPTNIEYYVVDDKGEMSKKSKDAYRDALAAGQRSGIKIKV